MIPYSTLKRWYELSPLWLRRAYGLIPFELRAGATYRSTRELIRRTDALDDAALHHLQADRLSWLLNHAASSTPFYRDRLNDFRFRDREEDPFCVLAKLPLVTKAMIQAHPDEFRAQSGVAEAVYEDNTGGSTGTPFQFIKPNSMYPVELAYMFDQWSRVGFRPGDRKLTFRGRTFVGRRPCDRWVYNPIYNELIASSYHLDSETVSQVLGRIYKFRPKYIHGYPSAVVRFLEIIQNEGWRAPQGVQAVLCGSEPLYDFQRQYIETVLGCRAYSWYGQSECVLLGGECEHSRAYHFYPLYGIIELVDDQGRAIHEPGVEGEIVGTSLNNTAMPFIRYCTGDRGVFEKGACPCGRSYSRLSRITGRLQHMIYTRDATLVPVTAFVFGQHFKAFRHIRAMQLVQDEPGLLLVRICAGEGYSHEDEVELRTRMESSVDGRISVFFEYPSELPVNAAGKTDFVIQNIQLNSTHA
jgi:phenylacetate-CoA ligase